MEGTMANNELETTWEEAVVTWSEEQSRHCPGTTEENDDKFKPDLCLECKVRYVTVWIKLLDNNDKIQFVFIYVQT
jgi:hypothetical protein